MSDSSLPQGSIELPRQFSFTMPSAEITEVAEYASRYAPVPSQEYCVLLKFMKGVRQWHMREVNATAWFEYDGDGPVAGHIIVPAHLLTMLNTLVDGFSDATINVDLDKKQFHFEVDDLVSTLSMPEQWESDWNSDFETALTLRAETTDLVKLGRVLMSKPVNPPKDESESTILPYVTFSFNGSELTGTRDWSRFDGPRLTATIPASGSFRGEFSCFAEVITREMFFADMSTGDEITISFALNTPNVVHFQGERWGIKCDIGHEYITEHRWNVVFHLLEEDIEVESDSHTGWDPVIQLTHEDRALTATIVQEENGEASFVRVSCTVLHDAPWNLQLAEEMNSWNNMWANCKLVRENNALFVVADVPLTSLEVIAATVRDVVEKTNNVYDVVGVFM